MTYENNQSKGKDINKLLQFCILDISKYGLICRNKIEAECFDNICEQKRYFRRSSKILEEYGFTPSVYLLDQEGEYIMEFMDSYDEEEQEQRSLCLEKLREKEMRYKIYKKGGKS